MSEKTRNGILKPSSIATNCIVAPIHIRARTEQGCSVITLTHCGGISKVVFRNHIRASNDPNMLISDSGFNPISHRRFCGTAPEFLNCRRDR